MRDSRGRAREIPDRLRQDALQLQFLGRAQRRARRHVAHHRGDREGLRLRRPERARPLFLGRQLRHPRRADHRRLRNDRLPDQAAVVERQAGHDRLFIDGRMAARGRVARPSGLRGDERPGLWRRRRQGRALLGAGQLVSRRRDADAVHHLDLRRAEPGAADVPERHAARGSDRGLADVRSRAAHASGRLGQGAVAPADRRTSSRASTARRASTPIACRSRPAA